jgi:DNA-nicking Smr family endonuclease
LELEIPDPSSHSLSSKKHIPVPDGLSDRFVVTDTLDLHGFFPEQISEMLDAFIKNALELKLARLRIIHGRGKSRLKFEVIQALKADSRVAAFRDAAPDLGGWGATVVELNDPEDARTGSDAERRGI